MRFYLGAHMPHWFGLTDVPLFVSRRRLARSYKKALPVARGPWALDSGAFTEISMFGEYTTTPAQYVAEVRRYRDEIGQLDWAAPQDHMCEPWVLAKSSLAQTVWRAQIRTVWNYIELRALAPELPFIPVLQGWEVDDYLRCVDIYRCHGIDLVDEPIVGVGSVCRRQNTDEIGAVFRALDGLRLHGFGVKSGGLTRYGCLMTSADSMAWSARGRRVRPCPHRGVTSCANCLQHALEWRERRLTEIG